MPSDGPVPMPPDGPVGPSRRVRRGRRAARHRRIRTVLVVVGVGVVLVAVWLGLCDRYIVHPRIDPVGPVDAMYVIGPAETRWPEALARGDEGVAPVFLVTRSLDASGHSYFPPDCGEQRAGYVVTCVTPVPYTTRGEARVLAAQVREHGWTHVAVFTSTGHAARARMLMERCVPAQVSVWDYPRHQTLLGRLGEFGYQSAAWLKAQIIRDC
ncbi:hypothetical protein [Raineyella sp. LH-20]|uniref:hypothetical protein n=1 Tax=Raineyella sp. LH-20 TaxID=3081204 RepID=UPI002955B118|nr:hypothetical protein [Raineyella sp. LH-20]WOP17220.1 hypothetical protein R0146_07930 [Raineyella sp. LH-20]